MKLLDIVSARSIWLIDLLEVNPRGKRLFPELADGLIKRYGFMKYPKTIDDLLAAEVKYENGKFQGAHDEISISLTAFPDGLVAQSRSSTTDTDAFLEDLVNWAAAEFSLVWNPSLVRKKGYTSEMHIYSEIGVSKFQNEFAHFISLLSSSVEVTESVGSCGFTGFHFGPDGGAGPIFMFERKIKTSFSENRYYSSARMKTERHFELLEILEHLFAKTI